MKRLIVATSNKKKSLDKFVNDVNSIGLTSYKARPNYNRNIVEIIDGHNRIVTEIELDTTEVQVTNRTFRKATSEEIKQGENLYVPVYYKTSTEKQINRPKTLTNIADKYNNT